MLAAYIDGGNLVVKVEGSISQYAESLHELKSTFREADREFDRAKCAWIIMNLDEYADVPLVITARRAAELQLPLF